MRDTDLREVDFVVLRGNTPEFAVEAIGGSRRCPNICSEHTSRYITGMKNAANHRLREQDIPYFCWDRPWTVREIRERLQIARGLERDSLAAWIMREAAFRDVCQFLSPAEARELLPRVMPQLGRWKEFWQYILGIWREMGRI